MILFRTNDPQGLLSALKQAIQNGHVKTWSVDAAGDFTHTPEQWRYKLWLKPEVQVGQLAFHTISNTTVVTTWELYGVYHGRFLEMMTAHFHDRFMASASTSQPDAQDQVTSQAA